MVEEWWNIDPNDLIFNHPSIQNPKSVGSGGYAEVSINIIYKYMYKI